MFLYRFVYVRGGAIEIGRSCSCSIEHYPIPCTATYISYQSYTMEVPWLEAVDLLVLCLKGIPW